MRIEIAEIRNHNDKRVRILDDFTNGDVIKALFPNITISDNEERRELSVCNENQFVIFYAVVKKEWWNAPYKGVEE